MALSVGYARCSSIRDDDIEKQRRALLALGADAGRIYTDVGLTGSKRPRPGLGQVLAACREGDTLVVSSLDRLARSVADAAGIIGALADRGVVINLAGRRYDPGDPLGHQLSVIVSLVADFETALIRGRITEGMNLARVKGRLKGRPPKLSHIQESYAVELFQSGNYTVAEVGEIMNIERSTVYREVRRSERSKHEAARQRR